jgi:alkylation response protein AidB-like acyl-CoA dehydrogenase
MRLTETDEQQELRGSVRRYLADKAPLSQVQARIDSPEGFDRGVWRQMAGQLGLQGLAIPERYGGSGLHAVELNIVFQEMGRVLYGGPYLPTIAMAAPLLLASGDKAAKRDYLPALADGSLLATVAIADLAPESGDGTRARRSGSGWAISGGKTVVVAGLEAELVLVVARTPDGLGVFAVHAGSPGVTRVGLPPLDLTRGIAQITFSKAEGRKIGSAADCSAELSRALDHTLAAVAAEQVGGAEACLDMAVQYAKTRVQFGRPIGSFQAVKHRCADMLMHVEFARAAAAYAAWAAAEDPSEAPLAAAMAKSYCSDVFFRVAADNIQTHGGIGFTWEHPAHLYFRRAKSLQLFLGDPASQRTRVAEALEL